MDFLKNSGSSCHGISWVSKGLHEGLIRFIGGGFQQLKVPLLVYPSNEDLTMSGGATFSIIAYGLQRLKLFRTTIFHEFLGFWLAVEGSPQRAQYPLIKEYGLNYIGLHIMV